MTAINSILTSKFPLTKELIEGQLIYLEKYGAIKLDKPNLEQKTNLDFYKAKFFTGYRKFTTIDVIVGFSSDNNQIYLLINPLFSDKHSDLILEFEKVKETDIEQPLITEIIDLYKEVGTELTEIESMKNLYQIWFGDNKWRILQICKNRKLTIKTTPNKRVGNIGA